MWGLLLGRGSREEGAERAPCRLLSLYKAFLMDARRWQRTSASEAEGPEDSATAMSHENEVCKKRRQPCPPVFLRLGGGVSTRLV